MPKELIIKEIDLKSTLNIIAEILRTDGNNQGGCGFINSESGVLHLLVQNADSARHVLESNKFPISEERDLAIIMAHSEVDRSWVSKLNEVEANARGVYEVTVPENGAVEISTHIEAKEKPHKPGGCSGIIFNILNSFRLTK